MVDLAKCGLLRAGGGRARARRADRERLSLSAVVESPGASVNSILLLPAVLRERPALHLLLA